MDFATFSDAPLSLIAGMKFEFYALLACYGAYWLLELMSFKFGVRKLTCMMIAGYHLYMFLKVWYLLGFQNPPWIFMYGFYFMVSLFLVFVHYFFAFMNEEIWPRRFQSFFLMGLAAVSVFFFPVADFNLPKVLPGFWWKTWLFLLAVAMTFAYATLVCQVAYWTRRERNFDSIARVLLRYSLGILTLALLSYAVWQTKNFGIFWHWGAPIETVFLMSWFVAVLSYQWRRAHPMGWKFPVCTSVFMVTLLVYGCRLIWLGQST